MTISVARLYCGWSHGGDASDDDLMDLALDSLAEDATRYWLEADLASGKGDGMYLLSYDPEADDGRGQILVTPDRSRAMRADAAEFLRLWQAVPKCHPETDGKPNRPLSAYTMQIEKFDDDEVTP